MLYAGTDPESYITEYALKYEEKRSMAPIPCAIGGRGNGHRDCVW